MPKKVFFMMMTSSMTSQGSLKVGPIYIYIYIYTYIYTLQRGDNQYPYIYVNRDVYHHAVMMMIVMMMTQ